MQDPWIIIYDYYSRLSVTVSTQTAILSAFLQSLGIQPRDCKGPRYSFVWFVDTVVIENISIGLFDMNSSSHLFYIWGPWNRLQLRNTFTLSVFHWPTWSILCGNGDFYFFLFFRDSRSFNGYQNTRTHLGKRTRSS